MYDDVCYNNSFLKEVIARVDFAAEDELLRKRIPPEIGNAAVKRFPISEQKKAMKHELQLSTKEFHGKQEEIIEWNYHGLNHEKRLVISSATILVTYTKYSSFEELKEDFLSVLAQLFKERMALQGARFGLRYVNNIEPANSDPFKWSEYIDTRLLGLFERFSAQQDIVTRLFNIAEFRDDNDIQIKFQFGAANPDYPARICRPSFVLDIDAYYHGLQDYPDIAKMIDIAHEQIQRLFEDSITAGLRKMMHA